jgi:hypothetical protein
MLTTALSGHWPGTLHPFHGRSIRGVRGDDAVGEAVAADDPKGPQLELALADDAGRAYQRAQREAGKPTIAFTTGDCRREYEQLVARGVTFTLEPTKMPYSQAITTLLRRPGRRSDGRECDLGDAR